MWIGWERIEDDSIKKLAKRWFVVRDVHGKGGAVLVQPRHAITWMRGPLTRGQIKQLMDPVKSGAAGAAAPIPAGASSVVRSTDVSAVVDANIAGARGLKPAAGRLPTGRRSGGSLDNTGCRML